MLIRRTFHALLVTLALCSITRADDNRFAKGTDVFELGGIYAMPIRYSEASMYSVTGSVGRFFWDNNSLSLELTGSFADQPSGDEDVLIGAAGVLGRWHFKRFDKWSIFLDGGGGVSYADANFPTDPRRGTQFNFYGKVGFGASYELHSREFLTGGLRYYHLSNGQIDGRDENPGYDALQFWFGYMWTR